MQFLYPSLAWGFLLVLLPLAIHLINLVRQRRIEWAAMEFLLHAYRRHRRWIWLKQLILLLLRMAAVALIVAMLAHVVTNRQWSRLLGAKTTHHLVLLDDSYSMSDRDTNSAFDRAILAVRDLAESASQQRSLQRMTLLRYSTAASAPQINQNDGDPPNEQPMADTDRLSAVQATADIASRLIDDRFLDYFDQQTANLSPTQLAIGPASALTAASHVVRTQDDEQFMVYLVSDFRQRNWQDAKQWSGQLKRLEQRGAEIRLVRCVDDVHENLAVTELRPAAGTRAAGVPLFFDVTVKNQGPLPAQNVTVSLASDTYRDAESVTESPPVQTEALPALTVTDLAPGESSTERFQAYFAVPGTHVIRASLPPDAVAADNHRATVVAFPDGIPILIVDGDPSRQNARYLSTVFNPGTRVQTGIRPTIRDIAFLRDSTWEALAEFRSIFLLDVPRLDARARRQLGEFVRRGGGLSIFLGPQVSPSAYNEWHATDSNVFPLRVARVDQLGPSASSQTDLRVTNHRLFRALQGDGNPLLRLIRVQKYLRLELPREPAAAHQAEVVASLRSGYPFAVDCRCGAGRLVVVASTLAPTWNNWATQPTFVVFLLELQSYLDRQHVSSSDYVLGNEPRLAFPASEVLTTARMLFRPLEDESSRPRTAPPERPAVGASLLPSAGPQDADSTDRLSATAVEVLLQPSEQSGRQTLQLDWIQLAKQRTFVERSGVLSLQLQRTNGLAETRRLAANVDEDEGELALLDNQALAKETAGTKIRVIRTSDVRANEIDLAGFSWTNTLLAVVCALLLLEQLLAYLLSYHPASAGRSR